MNISRSISDSCHFIVAGAKCLLLPLVVAASRGQLHKDTQHTRRDEVSQITTTTTIQALASMCQDTLDISKLIGIILRKEGVYKLNFSLMCGARSAITLGKNPILLTPLSKTTSFGSYGMATYVTLCARFLIAVNSASVKAGSLAMPRREEEEGGV